MALPHQEVAGSQGNPNQTLGRIDRIEKRGRGIVRATWTLVDTLAWIKAVLVRAAYSRYLKRHPP